MDYSLEGFLYNGFRLRKGHNLKCNTVCPIQADYSTTYSPCGSRHYSQEVLESVLCKLMNDKLFPRIYHDFHELYRYLAYYF